MSLDQLNEAQKHAVTLPLNHHALVIAGAGSGKTRVLTQRLLWLVHEHHIHPSQIVAVTFTNKAAGEMRERLSHALDHSLQSMWLGTFHSLCHRFLREYAVQCNIDPNFQIIDASDQQRLCRQLIKQQHINEKDFTPKQVAHFINTHKDKGIRAQSIDCNNEYEYIMRDLYTQYQSICERDALFDFSELLLKTVELWRDNNTLLQSLQHRFKHLLIDEFQDTNHTQYAWIQLLAGTENCVFAVGDDDQSIYGWRGAQVENIQHFQTNFSHTYPVKIARLEQNYRSSGNILNAANSIIAPNTNRLGKNLWTASDKGSPISVYRAFSGGDEAEYVVDSITEYLQDENTTGSQIAILYRSNAQSRLLEDRLLRAEIPYRVYGGLRFFERTEIKDVLCYARLLLNPNDNAAFSRIVNTPPRGIGAKSLSTLLQYAQENDCSLWQASNTLASEGSKIRLFIDQIQAWQRMSDTVRLTELLEDIITHSNLLEHYAKEGREKLVSRKENLDELLVVAEGFADEGLQAFIANTSLDMGESEKAADPVNSVQLMTLHAAKGLEFPCVFLVGLEDGIIPTTRSHHDARKLAEERRLLYVGITRAQSKLHMSFATSRQLYGAQFSHFPPSRFLKDLPEECIDFTIN